MIEAQAVDHQEQHLAAFLEHGHQELGADVHRERRAIAFGLREPTRVVLDDEGSEVAAQAALQVAQRLEQTGLADAGQPDFPARQLDPQLGGSTGNRP